MIGFESWWSGWPKKLAKMDAQKAYTAARRAGFSDEEMLHYRDAYVHLCKDRGTDRNFIMHAGTFIRGRRWTDEDIAKRLTPSEPLPLFVSTSVSTWNGSARKLIDVIGEPHFRAWFSDALFEEGPPARITPANSFKTNWIVNHYATKLNRLWPDIVVEVRQ